MSLFTEDAVLIRRGAVLEVDRYGRPSVREPDARTPSPAWWEPTSSSEVVAAAEQYIRSYTVYLPLSAQVSGADAIELVGMDGEFELIGEPMRQPGGFVVEGYFRLLVERVTG